MPNLPFGEQDLHLQDETLSFFSLFLSLIFLIVVFDFLPQVAIALASEIQPDVLFSEPGFLLKDALLLAS